MGLSHGLLLGKWQATMRTPACTALDPPIVLVYPVAHGLAAVPRGVIPDQQQRGETLGGELAVHQARKSIVTALTGRPVTNRSHICSACGGAGRRQQAIAGEGFGIGIVCRWGSTPVTCAGLLPLSSYVGQAGYRLHQTSSSKPRAHVGWVIACWIRRSRRFFL